jgi:hypothetical protein
LAKSFFGKERSKRSTSTPLKPPLAFQTNSSEAGQNIEGCFEGKWTVVEKWISSETHFFIMGKDPGIRRRQPVSFRRNFLPSRPDASLD